MRLFSKVEFIHGKYLPKNNSKHGRVFHSHNAKTITGLGTFSVVDSYTWFCACKLPGQTSSHKQTGQSAWRFPIPTLQPYSVLLFLPCFLLSTYTPGLFFPIPIHHNKYLNVSSFSVFICSHSLFIPSLCFPPIFSSVASNSTISLS